MTNGHRLLIQLFSVVDLSCLLFSIVLFFIFYNLLFLASFQSQFGVKFSPKPFPMYKNPNCFRDMIKLCCLFICQLACLLVLVHSHDFSLFAELNIAQWLTFSGVNKFVLLCTLCRYM